MRRASVFRIFLVAGFWSAAASADAQSPEEAVALVTSSMEEGSPAGNLCGEIAPPTEAGGSPARYRFECSDGHWAEATFTRLDGCRYEISTSADGKPDRRDVLDFSRFRRLSPARGDAAGAGHFFDADPGLCSSESGDCAAYYFTSMATGACCVLQGHLPRERVEAALAAITGGCRP